MSYIDYSTKTGWRVDMATQYGDYFKMKLDSLQQQSSLRSYIKSEKLCKTINGTQSFKLNFKDIANRVNSTMQSTGAIDKMKETTQQLIQKMDKTGNDFIAWSDSADILAQILNQTANGFSFSVNSANLPKLEGGILQSPNLGKQLSNSLGTLGESMSSVTGATIAKTVIEDIEKQLQAQNSKIISTEAFYENLGGTRQGTYRSQTDNRLTINFKIGTDKEVSEMKIVLNISDKLNSRFAKVKNQKTTGKLTLRNSTVKALMDKGEEKQTYNLISYHKIKGKLITYMNQSPGLSLRNYYGYKMLVDMIKGAEEYNDTIDFTVYGGKAIPESNILDKMLSEAKKNKYRYQAEIRYYRLKDAELQSEEQAEEMIDQMPVQIGQSFDLQNI